MRLARPRGMNWRRLVVVAAACVLAYLCFVAVISHRWSEEAGPTGLPVPEKVEVAQVQPGSVLLVTNRQESTLTFLDLATETVLGQADTGFDPREIAVTPDGRTGNSATHLNSAVLAI